MIKSSMILFLGMTVASVPAFAEAPRPAAPPAALAAIPGIAWKGEIAGRQAWGVDDQGMLWLHDANTGAIVAGFAFGADGASLHPDHAGQADLTLSKFIEINRPRFTPPITIDAEGEAGVSIPESMVDDVEARLALLDDARRQAAIRDLIEALRDVESEEAFQAAAAAWLETLPEPEASLPLVEADASIVDGAVAETAPSNASTEVATAETTPQAEAAADEAPTKDAAETGPTLIEAMQDGMWIPIGAAGAPVVHMLADPLCGPCAAGLRALAPAIEAGDIQVRYLPLPAASEDSSGVIAGILMAEDPAATLLAEAAAFETEGHAPPFGRFSDLDDRMEEGVRANYALAVAYELPQIPFFGFMTAEGPRYISGAAEIAQFEGLLPAAADE